MRQIVVLNKVAVRKGHYGYNEATGVNGDMGEMDILDPTMVAEALKKEETHNHGGGGGGMGGIGFQSPVRSCGSQEQEWPSLAALITRSAIPVQQYE